MDTHTHTTPHRTAPMHTAGRDHLENYIQLVRYLHTKVPLLLQQSGLCDAWGGRRAQNALLKQYVLQPRPEVVPNPKVGGSECAQAFVGVRGGRLSCAFACTEMDL
jgi:hypothetical protein